jgi:flavodoxin
MENEITELKEPSSMKSLLVLYSYHHHNTEKVAKVLAKVLDAEIKWPQEINHEELQDYDLIGFGSGIYSAKHHESLLELAGELPEVNNKNVFLFRPLE